MKNFLLRLATFFGAGNFPKGPGTAGTVAAIPFAYLINFLGPFFSMGISIALFPIAVMAADTYEKEHGGHDHKQIVIDEVLGFFITMTWLPLTWQSYVIGFLLFRVLDIFKPFPIGYLDQKVPGGLGVVVDDVAAGIIANIILQVVYAKTAWLGVQISL